MYAIHLGNKHQSRHLQALFSSTRTRPKKIDLRYQEYAKDIGIVGSVNFYLRSVTPLAIGNSDPRDERTDKSHQIRVCSDQMRSGFSVTSKRSSQGIMSGGN
jgi:hypothetical protein